MEAQNLSGADLNNVINGGSGCGAAKITLPDGNKKILIVDIDGVLAIERDDLPLEERTVIAGARDSIRRLKQKGYIIILCTSRFRSQQAPTIEWLARNNLPFDDIVFGKPRGILYIDDRGYRFRGWEQFFKEVEL